MNKFLYPVFLLFISVSLVNCQLNPEESENAHLLQEYLNLIFSGNISGAVNYMEPNVVFRWNGPVSLVPFAGTYMGHEGVENFFSSAFKYFANFEFRNLTMLAFNNNTIVVTFHEHSTSVVTGRSYSVVNVVLYTFSDNILISMVDIYLDSATVADALFCQTGSDLKCSPDNNAVNVKHSKK